MKKLTLFLTASLLLILSISLLFWYKPKHKGATTSIFLLPLSPTMQPPLSSHVASKKLFGVNIAGAEFSNHLPGVQNKDYIYPSSANGYSGFSYFAQKGQSLIRIPFLWERLLDSSGASLSANDVKGLSIMVTDAKNNNEQVILDLHNYARFKKVALTTSDSASFRKFWGLIADVFKSNSSIYGYELMNEPHDLQGGCDTWETLAQAGIDGIRSVDKNHVILVPGYSWQSANSWKKKSSCLLHLQDPSSKIVFSAHQYFDSNFSGQTYKNSPCLKTDYAIEVIQPFLSWLSENNVKGIFTEYGVNTNSCWLSNLDAFLATIHANPLITGGTYWAAGPWWGNYDLSVEPKGTVDKPQMEILSKYATYE